MIVECLEIPLRVDVEVAVVADGIAERRSVLEFRTTHPRIGGIITCVGVEPIEDRHLVERQLIRCLECLLIVERASPRLHTLPHRVLPCLILLWIEVFVDWGVWFLYLCVCGTLEIHVQVLCEVPTY